MAFVHGLVFLGFWVTMKELFSMPCQNLGWLLDVIAMFRKDFLKLFYLPVFESERFSLKVVFRKGLLAGQWRWRKLPLLHDFGGMARWGCHRQKSKRIQQKERQSKWWNKVTLIGCCHIYVDYIYIHTCINPDVCPGPTPVPRNQVFLFTNFRGSLWGAITC